MMQMKTAVNLLCPLYNSFTDGAKFISYHLQTWNICNVQQIFEVIMSSHVVNSITREMAMERGDKTNKEWLELHGQWGMSISLASTKL